MCVNVAWGKSVWGLGVINFIVTYLGGGGGGSKKYLMRQGAGGHTNFGNSNDNVPDGSLPQTHTSANK